MQRNLGTLKACLLFATFVAAASAAADEPATSKCPSPTDVATIQKDDAPRRLFTSQSDPTAVAPVLSPVWFAAYFLGRAQTEGEEWLSEVAITELCKGTNSGTFFPQTCKLEASADPTKQTALLIAPTKIIAAMRADLENLPECFYFVHKHPGIWAVGDIWHYDVGMTGYNLRTDIETFVHSKHDDAAHQDLAKAIVKDLDPKLVIGSSQQTDAANKIVADIKAAIADAQGQQKLYDSVTVAAAVLGVVLADINSQTLQLDPNNVNSATLQDILAFLKMAADAKAKRYADAVADAVDLVPNGAQNAWCGTNSDSGPNWCAVVAKIAQVADAKDNATATAALNSLFGGATPWAELGRTKVIAISAMAGAQGGRERLSGPLGSSAPTFGAFLPVGVDFNFPTSAVCSSAGAFVSLVDLGAWVSYSNSRSAGSASTTGQSKVSGSSAFSPGIYATCTLKPFDRASPFRVGVGMSKTPTLRSVDFVGGASSTESSYRALLFLSIDVPLMDLFKKN